MVSSFLVVNHYFLINFNYVVSAVLQTQLFQGRLLATWKKLYTDRRNAILREGSQIYIFFYGCLAIAIELELQARDIST